MFVYFLLNQILQQNFVCFSFNILTKAKSTFSLTLICEWKCNNFNVKSYQKNVERENKNKIGTQQVNFLLTFSINYNTTSFTFHNVCAVQILFLQTLGYVRGSSSTNMVLC